MFTRELALAQEVDPPFIFGAKPVANDGGHFANATA